MKVTWVSHGTCIWSNYSDLTRPHPKWWLTKGTPLISGKPRVVKYYIVAVVTGGRLSMGKSDGWNIIIWPDVWNIMGIFPVPFHLPIQSRSPKTSGTQTHLCRSVLLSMVGSHELVCDSQDVWKQKKYNETETNQYPINFVLSSLFFLVCCALVLFCAVPLCAVCFCLRLCLVILDCFDSFGVSCLLSQLPDMVLTWWMRKHCVSRVASGVLPMKCWRWKRTSSGVERTTASKTNGWRIWKCLLGKGETSIETNSFWVPG